jgi:hypothetical protein
MMLLKKNQQILNIFFKKSIVNVICIINQYGSTQLAASDNSICFKKKSRKPCYNPNIKNPIFLWKSQN